MSGLDLKRFDGRHADLLRDAVGEVLVDGCEDGELSGDDMLGFAASKGTSDVVDETIFSTVVEDLLPECAWLLEVEFVDLAQNGLGMAQPPLVLNVLITLLLVSQRSDAALVVGSRALADESAPSVPLEIGNRNHRRINRQLLVIHTKTMTVCIRVREQTRLEHRVCGRLDTRNGMRRRESSLFDLREVILRILVENEFPDRLEWIIFVRPDLGQIEDVVAEFLCLVGSHGLDVDGPAGFLATFDGLEEGSDTVIGVGAGDFSRLFLGEVFEATIGADVDLNVGVLALLVYEFEGMAGVSVLVVVAVGNSTITEEDHDLMDRFRVLREVIPEHIGIFQVSLRITLLGVDEVREFCRITDEEHGSIVEHPIQVTLLGPDLHGETSGVTSSICATAFSTDGRETDGRSGFVAHFGEELCRGKIGDVVGDLEVTVCAGTFGMDNTLGDPLTIEVSEEVDMVEVLKEQWAIGRCSLGGIRLGDGCTVGGGVDGTVLVVEYLF